MSKLNRAEIERLRCKATFQGKIASTAKDGNKLRIVVAMSSFDLMYSGRLMHPDGYREWVKSLPPGATLPMMAKHGVNTGGSFASVGKWDRFEYDENRGAIWHGWVGAATQLARDTQDLLQEGTLDQFSWGWDPKYARFTTMRDKDLDPYVRDVLEKNSAEECYTFFRYAPYEGSAVDVADDPGARRVAEFGESAGELLEAVEALRSEVAELRRELAGREGEFASRIREFWEQGETAFLEAVEGASLDPAGRYAELLLDGSQEACGHGDDGSAALAAAARLDDLTAAKAAITSFASKGAADVARGER